MSRTIRTSSTVFDILDRGFVTANDTFRDNNTRSTTSNLNVTSGFSVISSRVSVRSQRSAPSATNAVSLMINERMRIKSIHRSIYRIDKDAAKQVGGTH